MSLEESVTAVRTELETGIGLPKCQKCGCMESALQTLTGTLPSLGEACPSALALSVSEALKKIRPIQYACLGCEHCYPAIAQNELAAAFPLLNQRMELSCEFRVQNESWPPVVGEYVLIDPTNAVAVSTLGSVQLTDELARCKPDGLAIVGKTETENIGIDKVIKNVITSPTLRYLIVAGPDPKGHLPGKTLLALAENGVDENGRVIGAPGKRPILRNVSVSEIRAFREQVQVIDMLGCENRDEISARIEALAQSAASSCGCSDCTLKSTVSISTSAAIAASEPGDAIKLDAAGYFVIVPIVDKDLINVEHYGYDNSLLRVIEGTTARSIYFNILKGGWVTELSHAAYLGKELAKAELSLQYGFKYVQDGA